MKKILIIFSLIVLLSSSVNYTFAQSSTSDEQLGERTMEFMMGKETDEQMEKLMGPELSKRMHEMMGQRARLSGYGMKGFGMMGGMHGVWGRGMMGDNNLWSIFSLLWLVSWILGIVLLVALIRYFWRKGR